MRYTKAKKVWKNSNGITLIALVVTIIILIILALIGINATFGEGGILSDASRAKEEAENMQLADKYRANEFFTDNPDSYNEVNVPGLAEGGITLEKTIISQPANGSTYTVGENIVYRIILTNIGSVNIQSFVVEDKVESKSGGQEYSFTSLTYPNGQTYLNVGETGYIDYAYTVKQEDMGGNIRNTATIVETVPPVPKGHKVPTVEIPTEESKPDISVEKKLITPPRNGKYYMEGEILVYRLTVRNTGNTRIDSFKIEDTITAGSGEYPHTFTTLTNPEGQTYLEAGQEGYIDYQYTVQKADLGKPIKNMAEIVDTEPPTPPSGHKIPPVEIDPPKTDIIVEKKWQDMYGAEIDAPEGASVTIILLINEDATDKTLILSAENNWIGTFEGLDVYDESGEKYNYDVYEIGLGEFDALTEKIDSTHFKITNTQQQLPPPPTPSTTYTSLTVEKVWDDSGNEDERPESIQVQLYRDGRAFNKPVTLSETNGWGYTWSRLDDYYDWTVGEIAVPDGYTSEVKGSGTYYVITNTYLPETPIPPGPPPETPPPNETSLTVTKRLTYLDETVIAADDTFYVALFSDKDLTDKVSAIQEIKFQNVSEASTTFNDLEVGRTYYVAEVTEDGIALNDLGGVTPAGDPFTIEFDDGNKITLKEENNIVYFENKFQTVLHSDY